MRITRADHPFGIEPQPTDDPYLDRSICLRCGGEIALRVIYRQRGRYAPVAFWTHVPKRATPTGSASEPDAESARA